MSNTPPNPLPPPPALLRRPLMTPPTTQKPVAFNATTEKVSAVKPGSLQRGLGVVGFTPSKANNFCCYVGRKTFNQLKMLLYSNIQHITEEIPGLSCSHSMKVMELQAWYLDWSTKLVDTRREIIYNLTIESYDNFLGEVDIKDLKRQEAQPSVPSSLSFGLKCNITANGYIAEFLTPSPNAVMP